MYYFPIYSSFADMYMKAQCHLHFMRTDTLHYKIKESVFFPSCILYKCCYVSVTAIHFMQASYC